MPRLDCPSVSAETQAPKRQVQSKDEALRPTSRAAKAAGGSRGQEWERSLSFLGV